MRDHRSSRSPSCFVPLRSCCRRVPLRGRPRVRPRGAVARSRRCGARIMCRAESRFHGGVRLVVCDLWRIEVLDILRHSCSWVRSRWCVSVANWITARLARCGSALLTGPMAWSRARVGVGVGAGARVTCSRDHARPDIPLVSSGGGVWLFSFLRRAPMWSIMGDHHRSSCCTEGRRRHHTAPPLIHDRCASPRRDVLE